MHLVSPVCHKDTAMSASAHKTAQVLRGHHHSCRLCISESPEEHTCMLSRTLRELTVQSWATDTTCRPSLAPCHAGHGLVMGLAGPGHALGLKVPDDHLPCVSSSCGRKASIMSCQNAATS